MHTQINKVKHQFFWGNLRTGKTNTFYSKNLRKNHCTNVVSVLVILIVSVKCVCVKETSKRKSEVEEEEDEEDSSRNRGCRRVIVEDGVLLLLLCVFCVRLLSVQLYQMNHICPQPNRKMPFQFSILNNIRMDVCFMH